MVEQSLTERRNEPSAIRRPSSQDLVLAEMLTTCSQFYGRDLLPGETKRWGNMFAQSSPNGLNWAFEEHLRTSSYFPKPNDISQLLERYAEANRQDTYKPMTAQERAELEAHQATPEWRQEAEKLRIKLRELAGKVTMERPRPQPHIPTKVELAESLAKTAHIRGKR